MTGKVMPPAATRMHSMGKGIIDPKRYAAWLHVMPKMAASLRANEESPVGDRFQ